jgi:hypothetical protein
VAVDHATRRPFRATVNGRRRSGSGPPSEAWRCPPARAGLASAVNNTSRQACGAIGIAAFGAIAGSPAGDRFLSGLHAEGVIATVLFVAAAVASIALVPDPAA